MVRNDRYLIPSLALALAALALPASPALAQAAAAAPAMTVGAKVSDTKGGEVGTITAVEGDQVTLKTDKHEVRLPAASFTKVDTGYLMGMTRDELNAAVDASLAKAEALMQVGAVVKDTAGGTVGTIEAIDAEFVTVKLSNGAVKLPRTAFAATPQGPVIGMTAAQLEAQVAAATPAKDESGQ